MAASLPWYRRFWPILVAFAVGALTAIGTVFAKVGLAKANTLKEQAEGNKALDERLKDKDKVKIAKLHLVDAEKILLNQQAKADHEKRVLALKEKTDVTANVLVKDRDALAAGLLDSLKKPKR